VNPVMPSESVDLGRDTMALAPYVVGGLSGILQPRTTRMPDVALSVFIACSLHVAAALAAPRGVIATPKAAPPVTQTFDVLPEQPAPEPAAPPPALEPEPVQASAAQPAVQNAAPAPAPAQAAAVLTQPVDPGAAADMTDTVVMGSADRYAGGASAASGTAKQAVATAVVGGTGTMPAATSLSALAMRSSTDRSRRARLAEGASWACPFPPEADDAQLDQATVTLQISVNAAGAPVQVIVATDPGSGFGRAAKTCAQAKRYSPALDGAGMPVAGVSTVNVHFNR
jgi:periplasmic protein TonB